MLKPLLSALSTVLGHSMNALTGNNYPVSAEDSMLALSTTEMEKLNQRYGSTAIAKDCLSNGDKVTKMAFIIIPGWEISKPPTPWMS